MGKLDAIAPVQRKQPQRTAIFLLGQRPVTAVARGIGALHMVAKPAVGKGVIERGGNLHGAGLARQGRQIEPPARHWRWRCRTLVVVGIAAGHPVPFGRHEMQFHSPSVRPSPQGRAMPDAHTERGGGAGIVEQVSVYALCNCP